ncbi:MAG: hypothetical protein JRM82_03430, partial [Nitrososphaerota archaeon]|nr:hypothetical protein [Nitrososphaerota archaeon]
MGTRSGLYHVSAGYVRISRYFFLALAIVGLLGTATGVFAQSQQQSPQLAFSLSNVKISQGQLGRWIVSGTVTVSGPYSGQWSGPPLTFSGWAFVSDDYRDTTNLTLSPQNFDPASLDYPSQTGSNFSVSSTELFDVASAKAVVEVNAF